MKADRNPAASQRAYPAPEEVGTMADLREVIDAVDADLLRLLGIRLAYTDRAPVLKTREGIAARAPGRIREVLNNVRVLAERHGFDPDLAEKMWHLMIEAVIAREESVMGTEGRDA